jgi:hypothetical protein
MTIQDPADLLQRIPELEPLATDPRIRKAIESGDPFKVYRALVWAKWLKRMPMHARVLNQLLRQRRLFAKPLKGTPALGSLNSVGFGFVGSDEPDNEGTHIALHAFVVLFAIPLLPLGSYLVQKASSGAMSSQWRIFARVPMGATTWLYTRGLAVAAIGLVGFGAWSAMHASSHQEVVVVNGFDKPLQIELAGQKATIAAQQRTTIDVPSGKVAGVARLDDGTEVERFDHEVHAEAGYAVWNVGGVAPLFLETVVYSPEGQPPVPESEIPAPTIYCGESYFELGAVDYLFTEPPENLSMSRGQQRAPRTHLDVAKAEGGIQVSAMCANYALGQSSMAKFGPMFAALAAASGWDASMMSLAAVALRESGTDRALAFSRRLRDARPGDVEAQRLYLGMMDEAGRTEEVRRELQERLKREPDSELARYLDALMTDGPEGKRKLVALAASAKAPHVLRSATWREWVYGDHEAAARDWDALLKRSPLDAYRVLDAKIGAELALGRPQRALEALEALAATDVGKEDATIASYYALVAPQAGADPRALFLRLDADAQNPVMLTYELERGKQVPLKLPEGVDDDLPAVARSLRDTPEEALRRLAGLNRAELHALEPEHWALLYAEAARRGNAAALKLLGPAGSFSRNELQRMADYASGKPVSLDGYDIDPQTRAAMHFVRSRVARLPEAERGRLRREALAGDLLRSTISIAVAQWRQ